MSMQVMRARRAPFALLAAGAALMAATGCGGDEGGAATASQGTAALKLGANADVVWQKVDGPFTEPKLAGDTYSVDVGNGHTITWKKGRKLRIAAFEYSRDNTYQTANVQGVQDAAKAIGAQVTIFDAQNNPATQRSQIQNAIASKQFDAAVIIPIASQPSCGQVTQDLPAAGILVIAMAQQTCGRDDKSGADLYSPGTVAWVGNDWTGLDLGWAKAASDDLGAPTDALWIGGPSDNIVASLNARVLKQRADNHPNLHLVGFGYTDYTPAKALSETQNLLKAHPETGALLLQFGGLVPGVTQAVKQAGKEGKVKIYTIGGTAQDKPAIAAGSVTFTVPFFPYTQAYCAVEMLGALNAGQKVPRVVVNDCHGGAGSPDQQNATPVTKADIAGFVPQG
jgi:ribose transport system substrate-binding protein